MNPDYCRDSGLSGDVFFAIYLSKNKNKITPENTKIWKFVGLLNSASNESSSSLFIFTTFKINSLRARMIKTSISIPIFTLCSLIKLITALTISRNIIK